MTEYPKRSQLTQWEIVEDGEKVHLRIVHDDRPESLVTLTYKQLGETVASLMSAIVQNIGIRVQAKKALSADNSLIPVQPIPAAPFFQMHIAQDRSHVLLEFRSANGMVFQYSMAVAQAEGIARKILQDLDTYPPADKRH